MPANEDALLGRRIKALKPDSDCDENDEERPIPVGSSGVICALNHVDLKGQRHYDVAWDNGAWTVYSQAEVMKDLELIDVKTPANLSTHRLPLHELDGSTHNPYPNPPR
jgi:hypothetical protein